MGRRSREWASKTGSLLTRAAPVEMRADLPFRDGPFG